MHLYLVFYFYFCRPGSTGDLLKEILGEAESALEPFGVSAGSGADKVTGFIPDLDQGLSDTEGRAVDLIIGDGVADAQLKVGHSSFIIIMHIMMYTQYMFTDCE